MSFDDISDSFANKSKMIRLGGPAPPKVDPEVENRKATEAVVGNVIIFGIIVGVIRASPMILESLGISTQ